MTSLPDRVRAIPSWQITLFVALLALGFLVAAQLATEAPRVRLTGPQPLKVWLPANWWPISCAT